MIKKNPSSKANILGHAEPAGWCNLKLVIFLYMSLVPMDIILLFIGEYLVWELLYDLLNLLAAKGYFFAGVR